MRSRTEDASNRRILVGSRTAGLIPAAVALAIASSTALPATAQSLKLPDGVTQAMIDEGKTIFLGSGLCLTCHGQDGIGTPVGPNLTDTTWLHVDGSYDAIINLINTGVAQPREAMVPMLAKGGSEITAEQVRAVAAYVWSLCRLTATANGASPDACTVTKQAPN
jgi:mono/diheme cytochrome c family protein